MVVRGLQRAPLSRIVDNTALAIAKLYYRECAICGDTHGLQVHHIVLRSQGGDDVDANFCALCLTCHDNIHANKHFSWMALKAYVLFERPDTLLYIQAKLELEFPEDYFDRG